MKYLSVCSGIEAASVAWAPLGFSPVAFAEIEKFPSAVLAHHYPDVPNLGDMRTIKGVEADILVGGTPCQAFSTAGLRKSLEDERGNLSLAFVRLADEIEPAFVLWENVPGVLSTPDNAFGCFLGGLAGEDRPLQPAGGRWTDAGIVLGPRRAVAWRCLDAQFFGLAQRRKRLFVVACPRDGADPCEVLFESEGVRRDSPPSIGEEEKTSPNLAPCLRGRDNSSHRADSQAYIASIVSHTLTGEGFDASEDGTGRGTPIIAFHNRQDPDVSGQVTHPLGAKDNGLAVAVDLQNYNLRRDGKSGTICGKGQTSGNRAESVLTTWGVRRLTPRECERLQGFPDDYTQIPYGKRSKPDCYDAPRYRGVGNSMAVYVMRWIGGRIAKEQSQCPTVA